MDGAGGRSKAEIAMAFTVTFLKLFFLMLSLAAPLLCFFLIIIVVLGQWVGLREKWTRIDALYWSLITATTVGYGDFRPLRRLSKFFAVAIAITGILFTGLLVSVTLNAASEGLKKHIDREVVEKIKAHTETKGDEGV